MTTVQRQEPVLPVQRLDWLISLRHSRAITVGATTNFLAILLCARHTVVLQLIDLLMNDFTISPAQPSDIDALNDLMFALHDEHHQQCPEFFKTAEEIEQEKSIARYLDDPECLVFVAKRGEEVIGFVSGHFCELISTVSQPLPMGSVDELFVVNAYRHQGIAQTLLQKIEQTFTDYGVSQVFVEVWHFNQNAIALYQKSGFQHHIHWLRKALTSGK